MSKTILVTVADDRSGRKMGLYGKTQDFIKDLFESHTEFGITDFLMWKWEDIKNSIYYEHYKERLDIIDPEINGRLYKPLAIKEGLSKIEEGDFLVYNDTSHELWKGTENIDCNLYSVDILKKLCIGNGGILSALGEFDHDGIQCRGLGYPNPYNYDALGYHTHEVFTKPECMDIMDPDRKYLYCMQHASGFLVLQKNEKSIKFVDDWIYYNSDPNCCEVSANHPHRSDQSISGLLVNKLGNKLIRCLLGKDQHKVINPYNLLSFSQKNTVYHFIDSIQSKRNKIIWLNDSKNDSEEYKGKYFLDNWCVKYREI